MLMFMVAKASNGNCIYIVPVMYLAYLSNIRTDYFEAISVDLGPTRRR